MSTSAGSTTRRARPARGPTGAGDDAVQAYDYRLCLTSDPDNRIGIERPPNYDREEFLPIVEGGDDPGGGHGAAHRSEELPCRIKSELVRPTLEEIEEMGLYSLLLLRGPLPNDKRDLNTADLPGLADDYPEADWERRGEIARRHREHVLGLLYFLGNDEAVPAELREEAGRWGLPDDEFGEDGFPFQLYVREGRRIVGRETFTESDARLADGGVDPTDRARSLPEPGDDPVTVTAATFGDLLSAALERAEVDVETDAGDALDAAGVTTDADVPLTRGRACVVVSRLLA